MLKGFRTYISLALAAIANALPLIDENIIDPTVDKAIVTLLLALAVYFRSKA